MGRMVAEYFAPVCIFTREAAHALIQVQNALEKHNPHYRLKIFDTYRPTGAVSDFANWAEDIQDQKMKNDYYPEINKKDLFELGYISNRSGHSRGSTIDLTIAICNESHSPNAIQQHWKNRNFDALQAIPELDMGTNFDFFGELSHTANPGITHRARQNRLLLKNLMEAAGFENYPLEWWHYTLKNEPFPDTYFSFPVR